MSVSALDFQTNWMYHNSTTLYILSMMKNVEMFYQGRLSIDSFPFNVFAFVKSSQSNIKTFLVGHAWNSLLSHIIVYRLHVHHVVLCQLRTLGC